MGMVTAFTLVGALLINTYADIAQLVSRSGLTSPPSLPASPALTPPLPLCVPLVVSLLGQIGVVNVVYAVAEVLLFAGFIKLRYSHSDFYRPYTVPLDLPGCVCLVLPPLAFCVAIFVYASLETWLIALPLIAFGALLYPIKSYIRQRQWYALAGQWGRAEGGSQGGREGPHVSLAGLCVCAWHPG